MDYAEVFFKINPVVPGREILIAQLAQIGYESFMETDKGLLAYISIPEFNPEFLYSVPLLQSTDFDIIYTSKTIKSKNWNEVWESNFNPVIINDRVRVSAPFHEHDDSFEYDIVIEPKMSFGTAHHETTSMMVELMIKEIFNGKNVLDMGCGTGVLAIFSELLGAKHILAVDNDQWAYKNTRENIVKNKCQNIDVQLGDIAVLYEKSFDVILANINRNVLLADMKVYAQHLVKNGIILFSGFYVNDLVRIESAAIQVDLKLTDQIQKNNWTAARFVKL